MIDDMKTGYSPPGDIQFEEYGKPVAAASKISRKPGGGGLFGSRRPKVW